MPDYQMPFNPTLLQSSIPLSMAPQGMYAGNQSFMSPAVQQGLQPQGMTLPQDGMGKADMMKLASMAMQGFGKQQQVQPVTQQIIHDSNQFRFAGSPQQQMAQALRRR